MPAMINHHPRPTAYAGERALYATAVSMILIVAAVIVGSLAA